METLEKIKSKFKDWFEKDPKYDLVELKEIDVTEDPVRPELSLEFRLDYGRKIYGLHNESKQLMAIICVTFCSDVPDSVSQMDAMSKDAWLQATHRERQLGNVAVAYTVWAKMKGGGRHILNEIYKKFKREHMINRLVTLSPKTEMARKFHMSNGAVEFRENKDTINYEYDITLEEWEARVQRVKDRFKQTIWRLK